MRHPRLMLATLTVCASAMLACSGLTGDPVPPDKLDYVGHWTGGAVTLDIEASGNVRYVKESGARTEINAPIAAWHATGFDVGVGPLVTTFVVSAPPHQASGLWKMTVDGQELTRPGSGEPQPDRPERSGGGGGGRREGEGGGRRK